MKKLTPLEVAAIILTIAAFIFFLDKSVLIKKTVNLRPQEPKPPFPYYQEDITFENTKAGTKLAGTLTLPARDSNSPAVILISGGRNELHRMIERLAAAGRDILPMVFEKVAVLFGDRLPAAGGESAGDNLKIDIRVIFFQLFQNRTKSITPRTHRVREIEHFHNASC
jgi:hypothetical protein